MINQFLFSNLLNQVLQGQPHDQLINHPRPEKRGDYSRTKGLKSSETYVKCPRLSNKLKKVDSRFRGNDELRNFKARRAAGRLTNFSARR
jgi:hypothetical protein